MFLIDTDALSALRRGDRHPRVAHWLATQRSSDLYLSVVTIGEIERGIERQLTHDPELPAHCRTGSIACSPGTATASSRLICARHNAGDVSQLSSVTRAPTC